MPSHQLGDLHGPGGPGDGASAGGDAEATPMRVSPFSLLLPPHPTSPQGLSQSPPWLPGACMVPDVISNMIEHGPFDVLVAFIP